jgi:hypothetical protein
LANLLKLRIVQFGLEGRHARHPDAIGDLPVTL